ncbi:MAG: phage holin family protein [Bacteroidota bacterium]
MTYLLKTPYFLLLSITSSGLFYFIEKYIYSDWEFVIYLIIMITLDTVLGMAIAYKNKEISAVGFNKVIIKLITYGVLLIVTHILHSFKINGDTNQLLGWFNYLAYSAIMIRETISIVENLIRIKPNALPKWLIERLYKFDDTGK